MAGPEDLVVVVVEKDQGQPILEVLVHQVKAITEAQIT